MLTPGEECFTVADLRALTDLVAATWLAEAHRDWSAPAGALEWSCIATADHAVDCVYAPAFFLASRRMDAYPEAGSDLTLGTRATPELLVDSLRLASRMLTAVVNDAGPDVRAIIFQRPAVVGAPRDFAPRAALELILHARDVAIGLDVAFDPSADLCSRLREHTRRWPVWTAEWRGLGRTDDPWADLLRGSGRTLEREGEWPSAESNR